MRKVMLVAYLAFAYLRPGSAGAGEKNQPVAALEPNGYILGANREASLGQKPQNSLESVTSTV